eukprot:Pgem_evm1s2839
MEKYLLLGTLLSINQLSNLPELQKNNIDHALKLLRFPYDHTRQNDQLPSMCCVSLGEVNASFHFEDFVVINGFLAAVARVVVEETKLLAFENNIFGEYFYKFVDLTTCLMYRLFVHI